MDQLHEGFNERFKVMLSEDGGSELAALRWDPEQAGRGREWWDAMAAVSANGKSTIMINARKPSDQALGCPLAEARLESQASVQLQSEAPRSEQEEAIEGIFASAQRPDLIRNGPALPDAQSEFRGRFSSSGSCFGPTAFFSSPSNSRGGAPQLRQDNLKVL
eukprot:1813365-Rhodomonas_salina.4